MFRLLNRDVGEQMNAMAKAFHLQKAHFCMRACCILNTLRHLARHFSIIAFRNLIKVDKRRFFSHLNSHLNAELGVAYE